MRYIAKKSQPKVKAHAVEISDRRKRVVELMAQGYNQTQIANMLHVSMMTLNRDYKAVLEELASYRAEIGKLILDEQLQRLEYIWEKLRPGMEAREIEHLNAGMRLIEAKNKLLGIEARKDAPETQIIINYNGVALSDGDMITVQRERQLALKSGIDVEEGVIVNRRPPGAKVTRVSAWNTIQRPDIVFWVERRPNLDEM